LNAELAKFNERQVRLQLVRAEEHRDIAKKAIDNFYRNVLQRGLLNDRQLAVQKKELTTDALGFYQRMLVQEMEDPNLIQTAAETAARVGLMTRDVEEISTAMPYFQRSVELARNALAVDPQNVQRKRLLLTNINLLGTAWQQINKMQEAEACNWEAVDISSDLVRAFPTKTSYRRDLAAARVNLANQAFIRGDRVTGKADYLAALEQFEVLESQAENKFDAQLDLARMKFNLGTVADSLDEKVQWMEKSLQLRRKLVQQNPWHALARRDLVLTSKWLARSYRKIPEKKELALDVISEGIEKARSALKTEPDNLEFQHLLSNCLCTAGAIAYDLDRNDEAEGYFIELDPLISTMLARDRTRFRIDISDWLAERVELRVNHGQLAAAAHDRKLAIELIDEFQPTLPEGSNFRSEVESTRRRLMGE
jgi:tetratricopeptide (TPR) repeat protein